MANLDDFFNVKPVVQDATQNAISEFRPNPKKGQNGVFSAIVRFIPNPTDPANKSIISKYVAFLTDPTTQASKTIDCPSSVGKPDLIQNTFFALRNSTNPVLQENSKKFSRKQQFMSLVEILDCKSDPSLVNKILPWRYGIKVHEKIQSELNPPMGEPRNPFNILTGRPFSVQVKEVSGFPNYDSCGFFDLDIKQSGLRIISTDGQIYTVTPETISTPEGKQMVFDYLNTNAPDTSRYEYHDWTAEEQEFVNKCIQIYSNPNATIQAMSASQAPGQAPINSAPSVAQAAAQPVAQPTKGGNTQPFTMPTTGLTSQGAAPMSPAGFTVPQGLGDVDNLIDNAPKQASPSMGLNLEDVLAGQII